MLCDPDETVVLVEEYAFPGFFDTVKSLNVPVVPVEMDDKGMVPEALEEASSARADADSNRYVCNIGRCAFSEAPDCVQINH